ncbi:MAG: MATE family efflux transporter [Candidatus Eisenbacteria bacterium]|uniref:MATE family efflux transporter n=1 Tax=Eiseniibacteriota bacterium TaxID=2212470 RepID=A0A937XCV1_UNCEI|nr:MATE family efflux transporter [Candidatus Eisenbacteria bacterium]
MRAPAQARGRGRDLTQGPLAPALLALAWPVMLSSLLQTLYDLADAFWLGKLGRTALVAPTITLNVFFIALSLAMGLGVGGTTLVAQYKGAGRTREMERAAGQTLLVLVAAGFLVAAIGFAVAEPLLKLLRTPGDAFADTLIYLRWTLAGMPFMFAFFVYQGISTGLGDTIGPLKVNLVAVALNALLDPLLIFGLWIFPPLGVAGAAIASSLTRAVAGALGLRRMIVGDHGFRIRRADLRWDGSMVARMLRIGFPLAIGQTTTSLGFTLLIGVVNTFGSAVTAAFGIGNRVIHMALVPAFGLAQASATAVGQNLGADRPDRASRAVKISSAIIGAVLLPVTALMFFFGGPISSVFVRDADVLRHADDLFRVTSFSVFVFGFIMVLMGSFQGSGHTVPVMVLNIGRLWLVRIPAAYLLAIPLGMGPLGIWWAMFLSNTLTAIAGAIWFSLGTWKRKVIEEAGSGAGEASLAEG